MTFGAVSHAVVADEPSRHARTSGQGLIPSDAFISSPFSEFFRAGDYGQALVALDVLMKDYPDDPMLVRYRAIVLDRLGRTDEAMALYDQLLAKDPNHVPTRFFRAQTYNRKGEKQQAIDEFNWIVQNSPSKEYRVWSEEQLRQLGVRAARPVERKRFYLFGNTGWEYDSNVILKSNDPGVGFGADKNASRLNLNLGIGYRAIQRRKLRLDLIYTARQSLNDDGLDEFNFTGQELAVDLKRRVNWRDLDITFGSRYELNAGFLNGKTFSIDNQLRLSSDIRFSPRVRTYLYNQFTVSDFGPDGSNPPQTSRDGFGYDLGVTQYLYSSDYRSYVFLTEELNLDNTRGANFDKRGTTTRIGLRTPMPFLPKTDFDTSAGFRWGSYPKFESLSSLDRAQRYDNNWDYYVALTHRITPRLSTRIFYRLINANNRNDFFQYDRHLTGIQLLFTQYF
jgi:hypothetical protein